MNLHVNDRRASIPQPFCVVHRERCLKDARRILSGLEVANDMSGEKIAIREDTNSATYLFHPGVFECDGSVKDGFGAGLVIGGVGYEITSAFELAGETGFHGSERWFDLGG